MNAPHDPEPVNVLFIGDGWTLVRRDLQGLRDASAHNFEVIHPDRGRVLESMYWCQNVLRERPQPSVN